MLALFVIRSSCLSDDKPQKLLTEVHGKGGGEGEVAKQTKTSTPATLVGQPQCICTCQSFHFSKEDISVKNMVCLFK